MDFRSKLAKKLFKAADDLVQDYLTYFGMVLFFLVLVALKYPLLVLDRMFKANIRERFIEVVVPRVS